MFNRGDAMREMARKYLRLVHETTDPTERSKFLDYAMLYAQLSKQSEQAETPPEA